MMRILTPAVILICACSMTVPGEAREWTDSTGAFKVEAKLVEVKGNAVRLKKADGAVINVPLSRLSEVDRRYVRSLTGPASKAGDSRTKSSVEAIEAALEKQVQVEFIDTPLSEVVEYLCQYVEVLIRLDSRAMDDIGLGSATPITMNARTDLATLLDSMLEPLDLTWTLRDEILQITTPEEAESSLEPQVYRLRKRLNFDQLIADITRNIEPRMWSQVGGPGSIAVLPENILVIRQTYRTHQLIAHHYADLIEPIRPAERFPIHTQIDPRLKDALFQPTQVDFIDTPLTEVVLFLKDQHHIPITVDVRALEDVGIGTDVPMALSLRGIQLRSALAILLKPLGLTWLAGRDGIRITTPEAAEARPELVSHRVDDLITRQQTDTMLDLIATTVAPTTWSQVGGPGSVSFGVRGTLDVRQSFYIHMQLSRLLDDMRRARKPQ